jgi:hypothetical protein
MKTFWVSAINGDVTKITLWPYDPRTRFPELEANVRRVDLAHDPWKINSHESNVVIDAHRIILQNREEIARKFRLFLSHWLSTRELDPIPFPRDPYASIEWDAR